VTVSPKPHLRKRGRRKGGRGEWEGPGERKGWEEREGGSASLLIEATRALNLKIVLFLSDAGRQATRAMTERGKEGGREGGRECVLTHRNYACSQSRGHSPCQWHRQAAKKKGGKEGGRPREGGRGG